MEAIIRNFPLFITELLIIISLISFSIILFVKTNNNQKLYVNAINDNKKRLPLNVLCIFTLLICVVKYFMYLVLENFHVHYSYYFDRSIALVNPFKFCFLQFQWILIGILCTIAFYIFLIQYCKEIKEKGHKKNTIAPTIFLIFMMLYFVLKFLLLLDVKINNQYYFVIVYFLYKIAFFVACIDMLIFLIKHNINLLEKYKNNKNLSVWKYVLFTVLIIFSLILIYEILNMFKFIYNIINKTELYSAIYSNINDKYFSLLFVALKKSIMLIVIAFQFIINIPRKKQIETIQNENTMQDFDDIN